MIYNLENVNSRKPYHLQLLLKYYKSTFQGYHKKKFDEYDFSWKLIFSIPRIATFEAKICIS